MSEGYQRRDREIVDYRLWRAWPAGDALRGPPPPNFAPGSYFACIGAAQTFGCLVERPWSSLLAEQIGLPALNLGIAGAGPRLFLEPRFRPLLADARFCVVQVMSGRSADSSLFDSGGRERLRRRDDGRVLGADAAWAELLHADLVGLRNPLLRGLANRFRARFGRSEVRRLVRETQDDWVAAFRELLTSIPVPKLLLWFSRRGPRFRPRFHSVRAMLGEFPQLVDARMVAALRGHADGYVECVTSRGSPQRLPRPVRPADAGTGEDPGELWTHNAYYPSPEMHADAAHALHERVRELLDR